MFVAGRGRCAGRVAEEGFAGKAVGGEGFDGAAVCAAGAEQGDGFGAGEAGVAQREVALPFALESRAAEQPGRGVAGAGEAVDLEDGGAAVEFAGEDGVAVVLLEDLGAVEPLRREEGRQIALGLALQRAENADVRGVEGVHGVTVPMRRVRGRIRLTARGGGRTIHAS